MPWQSVRLLVDSKQAELLSDALMEAGALSVSLEHAEPATPLAAAAKLAGVPVPADYTIETVAEQDWVRLTQSQFDPIPISPRLWIVPTWHDAPDSSAVNLKLDPGLAFGTGSHPTTRLCLRWLDQHLRRGAHLV